jgi:hypothetical protein
MSGGTHLLKGRLQPYSKILDLLEKNLIGRDPLSYFCAGASVTNNKIVKLSIEMSILNKVSFFVHDTQHK